MIFCLANYAQYLVPDPPGRTIAPSMEGANLCRDGFVRSYPSSLLEIRKETLQCLWCFVNDIFISGFVADVTRDKLVVKR